MEKKVFFRDDQKREEEFVKDGPGEFVAHSACAMNEEKNVIYYNKYKCWQNPLSPKHNLEVIDVRVIQRSEGRGGRPAGKPPASEDGYYNDYYYNQVYTKKQIVLHFTVGPFWSSIGTLSAGDLKKENPRGGVPFVIGRSGRIYRLFDEHYWGSNSSAGGDNKNIIAIEIVNAGPLDIKEDGFYQKVGYKKGKEIGGYYYCGLDEKEQYVQTLPKEYRGYIHYATYTKEQYHSLVKLLLYLTDEFNIEYKFLENDKPQDPENSRRFTRLDGKSDFREWNTDDGIKFIGIVSHVNYEGKDKRGWKKWDIGPAFDWDCLIQKRMVFPLNLKGKMEGADRLEEDRKLRKVTRENIKAYYEHTERNTENTEGGNYPLGLNTMWHGGVHLFSPEDNPVYACAEGEVIAARLKPRKIDDEGRELPPPYYGSCAFILLRHRLNADTIRQLEKLHVPKSYTVKESSAHVNLVNSDDYSLRPGDVFERTDPEHNRESFSEERKKYPVKLVSVVPDLEIVKTFRVRKGDVKLLTHHPHRPGIEARGLKIGQEDFRLVAGDVLELIDEKKARDVLGGEVFEVRLQELGEEIAVVKTYLVKGDYTNFRIEGTDRPSDTNAVKDEGRLPDLRKGDELKVVNLDDSGDGEEEGFVLVELSKLADISPSNNNKEVVGYTFKQKTWFLGAATESEVDRKIQLYPKDRMKLIQKHSRVIGKKTYDLVKIESLTDLPKVPSKGVVRKDGARFYEQRLKTIGETSTDLNKNATFRILSLKSRDNRVEVELDEDRSRKWVNLKDKKVKIIYENRNTAKWISDLIDTEGYIETPKTGLEYGEDRTIKVGDRGYVKVPHPDLDKSGLERSVKHRDQVGWCGFVQFDNDILEPGGLNREEVFRGNGVLESEGDLTFEGIKLRENRDIRKDVLDRLKDKVYYSLYMHLNDKKNLDPSNVELNAFPWIPRDTIVVFKIRSSGILSHGVPQKDFKLIVGDELRVVMNHRDNSPPVYRVKLKNLAEEEIINEIEVKREISLYSTDQLKKKRHRDKNRVIGLKPGDKLLPVEGEVYEKDKPGKVEVKELNKDVKPAKFVIKEGRETFLYQGPGTGWNRKLIAGDEIVVVDECVEKGRKSLWDFVRVVSIAPSTSARGVRIDRMGKLGYVKRTGRDLDEKHADRKAELEDDISRVGKVGYLKWDDDCLKGNKKSRKALYGAMVEKEGIYRFDKSRAEALCEPNHEILDELREGKVVGFGTWGRTSPRESERMLYPKVDTGEKLWTSGKYLPKDIRKDLIHWGIFSGNREEDNLLPNDLLREWTVAKDKDDNWNMDCPEILRLIAEGTKDIKTEEWEAEKESAVGEILNPEEINKLYSNQTIAYQLRHFCCYFMIEWGLNIEEALRKLRTTMLMSTQWPADKRSTAENLWLRLNNKIALIDPSWVRRNAKQIRPLLWWDEAKALKDKDGRYLVELPTSKLVWHYNPIAFLQEYSALDLKKQDEERA